MSEVTKPVRRKRTPKPKPEATPEVAPVEQPKQSTPNNQRVLPNGLVVVSH